MPVFVRKYPKGDAPYLTIAKDQDVEIQIDLCESSSLGKISVQWIVSAPIRLTKLQCSNCTSAPYFSDNLPRRQLVAKPQMYVRDSALTKMDDNSVWITLPANDPMSQALLGTIEPLVPTMKQSDITVTCRYMRITFTTTAEYADVVAYVCVR